MVARVGWEGTTGGRPEEWWRAPAQRSWSGDEFGRRSWRQWRPQGTIRAAGPRGGTQWTGDWTVASSSATLVAVA
jgi:hypothetical protein